MADRKSPDEKAERRDAGRDEAINKRLERHPESKEAQLDTALDESMDGRMRPIRRARHMTGLHRIDMDVIYVPAMVVLVCDQVLPIAALPYAALALMRRRGERLSFFGMLREKADLIWRQRVALSASPSGRRHRQCRWSGRIAIASMTKGRAECAARNAARRSAIRSTSKLRRRSSRFTVKK